MIGSEQLAHEARGYLQRTGWTEETPGVGGSLWRRETPAGVLTIAVPAVIQPASIEWRSVVDRLAEFEGRSSNDVTFRLRNGRVDVTRLRAANDFVITGSIPLTAGVGLVGAAYKMLRATATTARGPRAHIAGNFSKIGDHIVGRARLAHTEEGSYVLPILMPLSEEPPQHQEDLWQNDIGVDRVSWEPTERRVTRTLAQALTAIETRIVQPAQDPKAADMHHLIAAGASRELVLAVHQVLADQSVASFEAKFDWAYGITEPAAIPTSVNMPAGAAELLERAATLLTSAKRDPNQSVTGPIVEVRHLPDDAFGEIALQTVRHGRQVEVRVKLTSAQLDPVHDWMRSSRTIAVEGQIQRTPGKPLRIDGPISLYPLDESYLMDPTSA